MRKSITILLVLLSHISFAQYHLKVVPNPSNSGCVNADWVNNYVISYTNDNWKTTEFFRTCVTYKGFDNSNNPYYTCYFEIQGFQKQSTAVKYARSFWKTYEKITSFETETKSYCDKQSKKYSEHNKKLNFKRPPNQKVRDVKVY